MELAQRRMRHLEPARPLRRLNVSPENHGNMVAELLEKPAERAMNAVRVEQFYEILKLHSQVQEPAKAAVKVRLDPANACTQVVERPTLSHAKERISYSRDVLISLASSPMAKKKPAFLPEHPVILEKARDQDLHTLFRNNFYKGHIQELNSWVAPSGWRRKATDG